MVNLLAIANDARSGAAIQALARELGVGVSETQRTVEALLPAFTLAFQRSAMDPSAFADLIGAIGSGRYAPYYDGRAVPSAGADRNAVLMQLFTSPEGVKQVAAQVASAAGTTAQIVSQMMPSVAGMLMGGMFRCATAEGISDLLAQWSEALKVASRTVATSGAPARRERPTDPWSAWTDVAAAMMGGAKPRDARPANPVEAWTATMAAMAGGSPPAPPPPPKAANPFEVLSGMFETGREVQGQHLADLRTVIDRLWSGAQAR